MDSDFSPADHELGFGFAFNDPKFSDRILRIEITDDSAANDGSEVIRVESVHISSHIFAAKSPFFYKLFSNGMRETKQRHVSLRIHASEEEAVLSLFSFMYGGDISKSSIPALLNVLIAADKFEVASCVKYCSMLLRKSTLNCESALLFLNRPYNIYTSEALQTVIDAAKQFLVAHYTDFTKFQDEMLEFPFAGIEAVLSSNDLKMDSENHIFDFVVKWSRMHHPELEDRKRVIGFRLAPLIRFPFVSLVKLERALSDTEFEFEFASRLIENAISYHIRKEHFPLPRGTKQRHYRYIPIKVIESPPPGQHCHVYMDITRERCSIAPSGFIRSQAFNFRGARWYLYANYSNQMHFVMFLHKSRKGHVSQVEDVQYMTEHSGHYIFSRLPYASRSELLARNSPYFVNGVLRLKVRVDPPSTFHQNLIIGIKVLSFCAFVIFFLWVILDA